MPGQKGKAFMARWENFAFGLWPRNANGDERLGLQYRVLGEMYLERGAVLGDLGHWMATLISASPGLVSEALLGDV